MSNNFEELQSAIKTSSDSLAKTQLLSVTLDPAYDTPKVLSDYAAFHHADPKIWTFATGDEKNIDSLLARFPFTGKPTAALSHMASPPP